LLRKFSVFSLFKFENDPSVICCILLLCMSLKNKGIQKLQ
jgi:hypothetical protein